MELLLIRHARPNRVLNDLNGADPMLDSVGRTQAQLLAGAVAAGTYGEVQAVVSSPMLRAIETARPTAVSLDLPITTEARIVELDHGSPTYGNGFERFSSRAAAWQAINEGTWDGHRFDPAEFAARVVAGIEDVVTEQRRHDVVAIFCHGGVVSAYLSHVLGAARLLFVSPDYTSVSRVLATPDGYRELLSVNERTHLQALDTLDGQSARYRT